MNTQNLPADIALSATPARTDKPAGVIDLGREIHVIVPTWPAELRNEMRMLTAAGIVVLGIALDCGVVQGVLLALMFVGLPALLWLIKPRRIVFCERGLALFPPLRAPVIVPYSDITAYDGGGRLRTSSRVLRFGILAYENQQTINTVLRHITVSRNLTGTFDPWLVALFSLLIGIPAILVVLGFLA